ncbi:MAG TPA: thioredoxin family protein [Syntrophales bacterium]|nr:thioredoxin family protein [Syntrophales bacterium]
MEIKILGPGCRNCEKLFQDAKQAAKDAGVTANIDKITDMAEIMKRGILSTPGLMINGKLRSMGRLPSIKEIREWIEESLKEDN